MSIEQINYNIDNFNNIKWNKESLKQFIEYLSNLDLNSLDNLTKQKVINFLKWAQIQRNHANRVEATQNDAYDGHKNKKKKSIFRKILFIFLIVIVLFILIGGIWYFLYTYIPKNFSDNVLYCVSNSDREDILEKEIRITFDKNKKAIQAKRKSISSLFPFPVVRTLKDREILYNLSAESLEYEEIKDFYLNKGYTCNGEQRREVDVRTVFSNSIIDDDRLYFQSNETTISTVDLNGKNKADIIKFIPYDKSSYSEIIYMNLILDNYLYFTTIDGKYKVNLDNSVEIIPIIDKLEINKEALQKANLYEYKNMEINYAIFNGSTDLDISRVIYNDDFISHSEKRIYMGHDVIYENSDYIYALTINGNYLYFLEDGKEKNIKVVKFDLESKTVTDELDVNSNENIIISDASDVIYDYNQNGIIYISEGNIFKLDYNTFTLKTLASIKKEDSFLREAYYIHNKIIIVDSTNQYYGNIQSIWIYDENTNQLKEYKCEDFKIANDNLYLFKRNENNPITKISLK